ncbi:DUF1932 domain-containing protein [Kitasatospora sp. NPDC101801]|uniref:NAD(P)-dependent oxidoreductase n=1 Tax=Kitasatospora sp. NPDC101801 TaxID=3364103 RepID=UPI003823290E
MGHTLGILHPGSMGAAVAACAASTGSTVLWCSQGRSPATVARAEQAGLVPAASLEQLLERSDVVLSLCPPANAEEVARQVAAAAFAGVFVEGNAISPERAALISEVVGVSARAVVDGAVIGSPPVGAKKAKLYLSGPASAMELVASLFANTAVATPVVGEQVGQASALKISYTSFQKASRVLVALAYGLAEHHGVGPALLDVAGKRQGSYLSETDYIATTARRAWRWAPELAEAADALREAGLPDEAMRAVAETLRTWTTAKDDAALTVKDALHMLKS